MKKLLCVLWIFACIFSFSSCDALLTELLEGLPEQATAEDTNKEEGSVPADAEQKDTSHVEDVENADTTAPKPNDSTSIETGPGVSNPEVPVPDMITVEIVYQSGGVHRVEDKISLESPATFALAYGTFIKKNESVGNPRVDCYLNDERIDPSKTIYLQDGDRIYLEESGAPLDSEYPCIHVWESGICVQCHTPCNHEEWREDRTCLICGTQLGVDLLTITIYEGEMQIFSSQYIEITVGEVLQYYYMRSWEDLTNEFEVYVNGVHVTEASYLIVQSSDVVLKRPNT